MYEEQQYAPIINFVVTEHGLVQVGIKVPAETYYALISEVGEVWKDYLRMLHEQVEANLSNLPQDG